MAPPHAFQKTTTAAAFVATLVLGLARPPENAGAFAPPPPRRSSLTMFSTTRRRRPMQMPQSEGERDLHLRPQQGWWGQQCRRTPVVPDSRGAADALFFRPGTGDDDAHSHHPAGAAGPVKVAAAAAAIAEPEAAPPLELEGLDPALWERARRELEAAVAARTTATTTASTATAAQSRSRGGGRKKKAKNKTGGKRGDGRTPTPPTGGGGGGGKTVTILRSAVVPVTVGGVVPSGADAEGLEVVSAGVASASPAVVGSRGENESRKEKTKRPAAAAGAAKIIAPAAVATSRRRRASQAPSSIGPGEQDSINMVPSGVNSAVRTNGALSARSSSSKRGGAAAVEKDTITGAEEALPSPSPSPSSTSSRSRSPRVILTREEEAELLGRIRALKRSLDLRGDHEALHHRVEGGAPPTEAEWAACHDPPLSVEDLRRIVQEGREARATLLAANEGLVVQIASKYARHKSLLGSALTPQDVIQEGRMGMMEAAERFDPARSNGARFGTYAAFWVRQRILRCIANHSRAIRLPEHVHGLLHTVNRARRDMTDEIGRVPTLPELAHRLEMPVDRLRSLEESSRHVVSLEAPLNPTGSAGRGRGGSSSGARVDDDRALGDVVPSDDGPTPEDRAEWDGLRSDVRAVMVEQLRDNERDVLVLRYGLDDGDPRTLDEVARSMGLSRERARLLEARALNKLRRPGRNHRLREYVGDADGAGGEPPSPSEEDRLWFF